MFVQNCGTYLVFCTNSRIGDCCVACLGLMSYKYQNSGHLLVNYITIKYQLPSKINTKNNTICTLINKYFAVQKFTKKLSYAKNPSFTLLICSTRGLGCRHLILVVIWQVWLLKEALATCNTSCMY